MASRRVRQNVPDPGGAYDLYKVSDIQGAVGGGAPIRSEAGLESNPFARAAVQQLAADGIVGAYGADIGNGYVDVYVRVGQQQQQQTAGDQGTGAGGVGLNEVVRSQQPPPLDVDTGGGGGGGLPQPQQTSRSIGIPGFLQPAELPLPWAQSGPLVEPRTILVEAIGSDPNINAVGGLTTPRLYGRNNDIAANWAASKDGGTTWYIPTARLGQDFAARDDAVSVSLIDRNRIATDQSSPPIQPPTLTPGGDMGLGDLLQWKQPIVRQCRRCPPGYVMAINDLCAHKKLLPAAFRKNRSRKAPVSWSDANSIRRGNQAQRRIQRFGKGIVKNARKLIPPRPRKRIGPGK